MDSTVLDFLQGVLSWVNRFQKLLVRYKKKLLSHFALTQLAAAIIALRKVGVIYG